MSGPTARLRGMTWDHPRGIDPLVAAAGAFSRDHPAVSISWEARPLSAFEQTPLAELADRFDLMVIDHPHVGEAAATGSLLPLDGAADAETLAGIADGSLGGSYESYAWAGRQWALPIDAAAQVSVWREGVRDAAAPDWAAVLEAAKAGRMIWPLKPVHALMSFFSLAANRGTPCRTGGPTLIEPDEAEPVFDDMIRLAERVLPESFDADPISASEAIVRGDADESPMIYGYVNYALAGFRSRRLIFGDLPLPRGDAAGSTLGGTGLCVSARSRHRRAAVDFATAVASSAWQRGLFLQHGGQPAHTAAWDDPTLDATAAGFFSRSRDTLDRAWTRPRFHGYIPFQLDAGRIVVEVLRDRLRPADAARRLNQRFAEAQTQTCST